MDEPKRCASCDVQVEKQPLIVEGSLYCCRGCAAGGPCTCSYVGEPSKYPRNGHRDRDSWDLYGDVA